MNKTRRYAADELVGRSKRIWRTVSIEDTFRVPCKQTCHECLLIFREAQSISFKMLHTNTVQLRMLAKAPRYPQEMWWDSGTHHRGSEMISCPNSPGFGFVKIESTSILQLSKFIKLLRKFYIRWKTVNPGVMRRCSLLTLPAGLHWGNSSWHMTLLSATLL